MQDAQSLQVIYSCNTPLNCYSVQSIGATLERPLYAEDTDHA